MTSDSLPAEIRKLGHFSGARDARRPLDRIANIREGARKFRNDMLGESKVLFYKSCPLVQVPYPTRYGFLNAWNRPVPFLHITNRVFIVQFRTTTGVKTLLVSPSDVEANRATPFFRYLEQGFGPLSGVIGGIMAPRLGTVEAYVESAGLRPEDIDYITYDHMHTQDVRRWLGTGGEPGYFPNAKLLIMRQEWDSTSALTPPQAKWYCPNGIEGVDPARVVLLDDDVMLGEGVALVRTPGHTEGNHSIVCHTDEGLMVTSENGMAPECYAPLRSKIPGLARYARRYGYEVILNGNTLEGAIDQYISMIQEKEIAGPSARNPDFPNIVCSSELTSWWAAPGTAPTFSVGNLEFGRVIQKAPSQRHAA
jgi:glyoxylase-like metal-dependent hydrolase (beta-lactamase superfamily II)